MNFGNISDQLPTYPSSIQGELRLILQTKDVFLVCYKHLEEYRRLVNEQNRLITKEFVQEQLQMGEDEIAELKMELTEAESRLGERLKHNELLADHLAGLGFGSLESGASLRHLTLVRSPHMRKNMLSQRHGAGSGNSDPRPPTHMIDNIALAISEIHTEVRTKVKPLLDYYRDLFYLQLHFSLVLGQVCNYCMPLVTQNIGLIDRIFFWSERPEFDLVRRATDIGDRLKEIYTRAQTVLSVLAESVRFLQSKVELQKTLEIRFHERLDEQQKTKDKILRDVHSTKQNMDTLEEENDRLVGSLVKVDPSFVDSRHFYELAEGGNINQARAKEQQTREGGRHNAAEAQDSNCTMNSPSGRDLDDVADLRGQKVTRRNVNPANASNIPNQSRDVNNNKALSTATDVTPKIIKSKSSSSKKKAQGEIDTLLMDLKSKLMDDNSNEKHHVRTTNAKHVSKNSGRRSSMSTTAEGETTNDETSIRSDSHAKESRNRSKSRSKSRKRESSNEHSRRTPTKHTQRKSHRRTASTEKQFNESKQKKLRSKSSVGVRRIQEGDREVKRKMQRSKTPEAISIDHRTRSVSPVLHKKSPKHLAAPSTLKSKLLGRTKDIFEAALNRAPKDSLTPNRMDSQMDSSNANVHNDSDDFNNDAVTSASSLASFVISEPASTELKLEAPGSFIPTRQLRTLGPKKKDSESKDVKKRSQSKIRAKRKEQANAVDYGFQKLQNLSSEVLLTESPEKPTAKSNVTNYQLMPQTTKRPKSRKTPKQGNNHLSNHLLGTGAVASNTSSATTTPVASMI